MELLLDFFVLMYGSSAAWQRKLERHDLMSFEDECKPYVNRNYSLSKQLCITVYLYSIYSEGILKTKQKSK